MPESNLISTHAGKVCSQILSEVMPETERWNTAVLLIMSGSGVVLKMLEQKKANGLNALNLTYDLRAFLTALEPFITKHN